jgi:hypothetical protein
MYTLFEKKAGGSAKKSPNAMSFSTEKEAEIELARCAAVDAESKSHAFQWVDSSVVADWEEDDIDCSFFEGAGYYYIQAIPYEIWLSKDQIREGINGYNYDTMYYFVEEEEADDEQ